MASGKPTLTVIVSPNARKELESIYTFNAEHKSRMQADKYEEFLLEGIGDLAPGTARQGSSMAFQSLGTTH